jgi:hypothetical protein
MESNINISASRVPSQMILSPGSASLAPSGLSIPALKPQAALSPGSASLAPSGLSPDEKVRILLRIDNLKDILNIMFVNKEYKIYTDINKCKVGGERVNDLLCTEYIEERSNYHLIKTYDNQKIWHVKSLIKDQRFKLKDDMLLWATYEENVQILKFLLNIKGEKALDPTVYNNWCLRCASAKGFVKGVELLMEWEGSNGEKVDPTACGNLCLKYACKYGFTEIVNLLLKDPRVKVDESHIKIAYEYKNFGCLPTLILNSLKTKLY